MAPRIRFAILTASVLLLGGLSVALTTRSGTTSDAAPAASFSDEVVLSQSTSRWVGGKEHRFFGKFDHSVRNGATDRSQPGREVSVERETQHNHDHQHDHGTHDDDVAAGVELTSGEVDLTFADSETQAEPPVSDQAQNATPSCSELTVQLLDSWLTPRGIPLPGLILSETSLSTNSLAYYDPSTRTIVTEGCPSQEVLAHETGHYIIDFRAGSWANHVAYAGAFCPGFDSTTGRCEGGWLTEHGLTTEAQIAPGIEHAAHCAGKQLIGDSIYTRCPDPALDAS
ncbi:MAG: hypothetical protein EBY42_10360, partial [Actinobacteria bacterium]|nr:hypothetical protein [Actinomycetota bacterium]